MGLLIARRAQLALAALSVALASCSPIRLARPLDPVEAIGLAPGQPLELAWERNVEGGSGPGAPIVSASFVALGTQRGDVAIVGLADGALEGSSSFGESVEGRPALAPDGRTLFVPLAAGRDGVLAHDLVGGQTRWRTDLGPVVSGPLVIGQTVVAAALDGTLAGLATADGATRWTTRRDTTAAYHASPVAVGSDVIAADDRGRVVRFGAADGSERWSVSIGEPVYNAMAIEGDLVVIPTTRGSLVGLSAARGSEVWRVRLGDGVRVGAPAISNGRIVVGTTEGDVVAVEAATGAEIWRTRLEGVVRARPAFGDGIVYVGTFAQRLAALDLATGMRVWDTEVRGRVKTDLTVADGLLIVVAEPRHVLAYRTAGGEP